MVKKTPDRRAIEKTISDLDRLFEDRMFGPEMYLYKYLKEMAREGKVPEASSKSA